MKFSFFKYFADRLFKKLFGKPDAPKSSSALHRSMKTNNDLQAIAHDHAKQRRLMAWKRSVEGGYDNKRELVKLGKGHNTLAGIPA